MNTSKKRRAWTAEEERMMLQHFSSHTDKEMLHFLPDDRTAFSVAHKAREMGLVKSLEKKRKNRQQFGPSKPKPVRVPPPAPVQVGQVFGRLTVFEVYETTGGRYRAKCDCVCGEVVDQRPSYLINGVAKSCGCLQRDMQLNKNNIRFAHNARVW